MNLNDVYICDYIRTPIGKFGGALSSIRTDDLAALPLTQLMKRQPKLDLESLGDVIFGCANQAGEDNRSVARMALLLAGMPASVSGTTLNRLCGSGMDAVLAGFRQLALGESEIVIAGGVESMSRAPFVVPKATSAFSRNAIMEDTTLGWRFINPKMKEKYGVESMPETAENVAEDFLITRADQDAFALRSQQKAADAVANGTMAGETFAVSIPQRRGDDVIFDTDEHLRSTTIEKISSLPTPFRVGGSVTAGNASGVNDGAAAMILATSAGITRHGLVPMARILGGATAGVEPRIMGIGPAPASEKLMLRLGLNITDFAHIELNEAFASQALAVSRKLGLSDDDPHINPYGGAIALGHPLGMTGVRITGTIAKNLQGQSGKLGLATMCIGVGQGIAIALEAV